MVLYKQNSSALIQESNLTKEIVHSHQKHIFLTITNNKKLLHL